MSQSAATPKGLSPQVAKESLAYLRRAIERMKSLQATERVIACLERVVLNRVPEKFELKALIVAINSLNLAMREGDEAKVALTRDAVKEELETTLAQLVRRDEVIMPYDLRRFCEGDSSLLDLNSLAALTSFYRALPPSETSRSKYDFVITRLFSSAESGHSGRHRHLKVSREQITKRLTEMCQAWGETLDPSPAYLATTRATLQQFDDFIAEIKTIPTLEELISKSFFQRVRVFKAGLGNQLFWPAVTAASVEANITIANRFLLLLEAESEEMREVPEEIHSLADAFSDTYGNESSEISRILEELQISDQQAAQAHVSRYLRLLQVVTKEEEPGALLPAPVELPVQEMNDQSESASDLENTEAASALAAEGEELQVFAAPAENEDLLAAYRNASAEARKIDLHCFLSPLPDGEHEELRRESKTRRTALALIFCADQMVQHELGYDQQPENDIEGRVDKLFDDLGQCSDEMRELINVTHQHQQNANYEVLLHVNNQLMAARLRLQSAIVRRTVSEILPDDSQKEEITQRRPHKTAPKVIQKTTLHEQDETQKPLAQNARRKWLVIAGILLVIAAVGLRFAVPKENATAKDDATVVRLAPKEVPSGQMFAEIKLHRDLLLCIVTENWLTLSSEDQKHRLQELLRFGQERGAVRVLLVDPKGTTVGIATKDDLYVN